MRQLLQIYMMGLQGQTTAYSISMEFCPLMSIDVHCVYCIRSSLFVIPCHTLSYLVWDMLTLPRPVPQIQDLETPSLT